MSAKASLRVFLLGIAIFLAARAYLVIAPTAALETTRLGDDSLVYLWKGSLAFNPSLADDRALEDLRMQRFLSANPSPELLWERSNAVQRTLGDLTPTYNPVTYFAVRLTDNLRWAFALSELFGLAVMTAGFAWFLFELVGLRVAGGAMVLMAFAILPNQGIYSFIPSNLALSSAFCLWAYLLRKGRRANPWLVAIISIWIAGLHPIGKLYVVLAPAMPYFSQTGQRDEHRYWLRIVVACLSGIVVIAVLPFLFPHMAPPPSAIMGGIGQFALIADNLRAVAGWVVDPFIIKNPLWFVLLCCAFFLCRSINTHALKGLGLAAMLLLGGTLLHVLPAYPAELFSRIWVVFFLLCSAAASSAFFYCYAQWSDVSDTRRYLTALFIYVAIGLSAVYWVVKYVPMTMNWRSEIVYEDLFRRQMEVFPADATLLYADTNNSLLNGLLLGGATRGALVYPMLSHTSDLERLIRERRPAALVVPGDDNLNSLAQVRKKLPVKRKLGISSAEVARMRLHSNHGFRRLAFEISSDKAGCWRIRTVSKGALENQEDLCFQPGRDIYRLKIVGDNVNQIEVDLPKTDSWLVGIRDPEHSGGPLWPWSEGWTLSYWSRSKPYKEHVVDFSVAALLERQRAGELLRYVEQKDPVIGDDSGMVFLRMKPL